MPSGSYSLHSLTNRSGNVVLSGGTLALPLLDNQASLFWSAGSIELQADGTAAGLQNDLGAILTIAANGQRLSGTGAIDNAGTILVAGAPAMPGSTRRW